MGIDSARTSIQSWLWLLAHHNWTTKSPRDQCFYNGFNRHGIMWLNAGTGHCCAGMSAFKAVKVITLVLSRMTSHTNSHGNVLIGTSKQVRCVWKLCVFIYTHILYILYTHTCMHAHTHIHIVISLQCSYISDRCEHHRHKYSQTLQKSQGNVLRVCKYPIVAFSPLVTMSAMSYLLLQRVQLVLDVAQ